MSKPFWNVGVWVAMMVAGLQVNGQNIEVSRTRVSLDNGNVLGTAIYEEKGIFFVLQSVVAAGDHGHGPRSHLQLSSWNLESKTQVKTRDFEEAPDAPAFPCGRLRVSKALRRLVSCGGQTRLQLIDPTGLNVVATMAEIGDGVISDFAIDDERGRVLVIIAATDNHVIRLASYALDGGAKQQEVALPTTHATRALLAIAPTGQIGIAVNLSGKSSDKADVFSCAAEPHLSCTKAARIETVSEVSVLGKRLLLATNKFADSKKDCITSVDLSTGNVGRAYCSPSTGVHYALGVVANSYVVGFTGISKRNWFTEENSSVNNSVSLWRTEGSEVVSRIEDPTDYGTFQGEIGIVASNTKPLFITYHRLSNTLVLYSIANRCQ